ncbi:pulmonary surfactant-associated protein D-like [Rana temporaria]|uniref:pulmonary surfactant-associated protein D-like n=1 Tax=Rana temporaria TaxID=8407 RepID=UPI001AADB22C|nr:pulmonary surfactant-associated protein D-like [Rana temporaria]
MKAQQVFCVIFLYVTFVTSHSVVQLTKFGEDGVKPRAVSSPLCTGCEDLREKVKALDEQQKELKTAFLFFKGRAKSGDKIYLSDGEQGNFENARERCTKAGGQMASPTNAEENEAIRFIINQYNVDSYLGINELEELGTYRYPGGLAISFTNWNVNEPNNFEGRQENCVEMQNTGRWNDIVCASTRLIICEFSITRL